MSGMTPKMQQAMPSSPSFLDPLYGQSYGQMHTVIDRSRQYSGTSGAAGTDDGETYVFVALLTAIVGNFMFVACLFCTLGIFIVLTFQFKSTKLTHKYTPMQPVQSVVSQPQQQNHVHLHAEQMPNSSMV